MIDGDCPVGRDVGVIAGVDLDRAKARLMERIALAERERDAGTARDAFGVLEELESRRGLS